MKFPFSLFEKKPADSATTQIARPSIVTPVSADELLSPPVAERPSFQLPPEDGQATAAHMDPQSEPVISAGIADEALSASESETEPLPGQMDTDLMTAEDIIAAYKIFLRRRPENMDGVTPRVGLTADRILFDYLMSDEFTGRPEVAQLVFNCAKKIVDAKKFADEIAAVAKAKENSEVQGADASEQSAAPDSTSVNS